MAFWQPVQQILFALECISVRILQHKLVNDSFEALKTRSAKWLLINKTLWNQITLAIILLLSQLLTTGTAQISVAFASPQT